MLSPRLITFTDGAPILVSPSRGLTALRSGQNFEPTARTYKHSFLSRIDTVQITFSSWYGIVETYSRLEITNPEQDRLVALAGVAIDYGIKTHVNMYLCGLWMEDIVRGLQWERADRNHQYRLSGLPTWSWASLWTRVARGQSERAATGLSVRWSVQPRLHAVTGSRPNGVMTSPEWSDLAVCLSVLLIPTERESGRWQVRFDKLPAAAFFDG
jgi:hypothetical protein